MSGILFRGGLRNRPPILRPMGGPLLQGRPLPGGPTPPVGAPPVAPNSLDPRLYTTYGPRWSNATGNGGGSYDFNFTFPPGEDPRSEKEQWARPMGPNAPLPEPDPILESECQIRAIGAYNKEWAFELNRRAMGLPKSSAPPQPSHDHCENFGIVLATAEMESGQAGPAVGLGAFFQRVAAFKAAFGAAAVNQASRVARPRGPGEPDPDQL